MTATRKNEIFVGLLVVVAIGAMLAMTLIVRGNTGLNPYELKVTYSDVAGLEIGSAVLVSGFRVGRVAYMEPTRDPEGNPQVIVHAKVGRTIPIYKDAKVKLAQQGFLGDMRLEIHPGNEKAGEISDGMSLESIPPLNMASLFDNAGVMAEDLQVTLREIRTIVTDPERTARADSIMRNVDRTSGELADLLEERREELRATITNVEQVTRDARELTQRADRIMADAEGRMTRIGDQTEQAIAQVRDDARQLVERAETITTNANGLLADGRGAITDFNTRLAELTDNMNALLTTINEGQGTVGRLLNDPRPFNDLQQSIAALRNMLLGEQETLYDRQVPYRARNAPGANPAPATEAHGTQPTQR